MPVGDDLVLGCRAGTCARCSDVLDLRIQRETTSLILQLNGECDPPVNQALIYTNATKIS
jgi:hypothetical protein